MTSELPPDALDLDEAEVRARFRGARRRGRPDWLWPEVEPSAWRAALARVEDAARAVFRGARPPPLACDPAALGVAAYTSGMGPLLGVWVERGEVEADPACAALLALHLGHNRLRMERLTREGARAAEVLAAAGVRPVVLKGMHTAHEHFPEPGARPVSDVDLWIPAGALAAAEAALREAGYVRSAVMPRPYRGSWAPPEVPALPRSLRLVHAADPWSLDLQVSLDRAFSPATVARLDGPAAAGGPAWGPGAAAGVLPQPLLLAFLAAHASESSRSLTMVRLVELVLVARRDAARGALSWDALAALAERAGALGCLHPALALAERLAEGTVPAAVLAAAAASAPPAVRRVIGRLTPATAQGVGRWSLEERYMWSPTWGARLRQLAHEAAPAGYSPLALARIYGTRGWRLLRGTLGR